MSDHVQSIKIFCTNQAQHSFVLEAECGESRNILGTSNNNTTERAWPQMPGKGKFKTLNNLV